MRVWILSMFLLSSLAVASDAERFVTTVALPTGQTAVVAEGDLEARSLGSFSVRLYAASETPNDTTFFITGLIQAREGRVEEVLLADIEDNQKPKLVVITRSVGTGNYLSAYAFDLFDGELIFYGAMEGLAADLDPVAALREANITVH
ncbi:MAG: hypothetical protein GX324_04095 [Aeromonadales bacterium]|nr:hypothetical protein [Aeromonadales bacterium]